MFSTEKMLALEKNFRPELLHNRTDLCETFSANSALEYHIPLSSIMYYDTKDTDTMAMLYHLYPIYLTKYSPLNFYILFFLPPLTRPPGQVVVQTCK